MKQQPAQAMKKRHPAAKSSMLYTRRTAPTLGILIALLLLATQLVVPAQPVAATWRTEVTNTNNSGYGSLRRAIINANLRPGLDTITFNIPGNGPHTIRPKWALPTIRGSVVIDGYSQPGASPNTQVMGNDAQLLIEIDGSNAGRYASGLKLRAGNSTVRGLVINRFKQYGIVLYRRGGNTIEGNYIGTDVAGVTDLGNSIDGVTVFNIGNNTIGGTTPVARNLLSGNDRHGVRLLGSKAQQNTIQGNYIGTDSTGSMALGNSQSGVGIYGAHNNTVGGTDTGAGNLIAGNSGSGTRIWNDGSQNTIQGNYIGTDATGLAALPNSEHGVLIDEGKENTIGGGSDGGNLIAYNNLDGVSVSSGTGNAIRINNITDNGDLGIDLDNTGVTDNDTNDGDEGANNLQNFPRLVRAYSNDSGNVVLEGFLNSSAETTFELDFYASPTCSEAGFGEGATFLGAESVVVDGFNIGQFTITLDATVDEGQAVTATATDPQGNTSEFAQCIVVNTPNDSWADALSLDLAGNPPFLSNTVEQFLDVRDQARWFRFPIQPNSQVVVTLDNLKANYDLIVFKDIEQAANQPLTSDTDLVLLNAGTPDDAFNPDELPFNTLEAQTLFPEAYEQLAFEVQNYTSAVIAPHARSPHARSPHARSPHARSPHARSPHARSPAELDQLAYNPDVILLDSEAFDSAQERTVVGVSALDGTAAETVVANTWNNTGFYYVRVKGRNGAFDVDNPFRLTVSSTLNGCEAVQPISTPSNTTTTAGGYETIIVTDLERMEGSTDDKTTLQTELGEFANRSEVNGVIVDVGSDQRVAAARAQSDANPNCPYAANLVAESIKEIVDNYRELNPLAYVVLVGNDDVIPFFRYPDQSPLGGEADYEPPVLNDTTSETSLRENYILGQDAYGSQFEISLKTTTLPVPDLPVGRLTETASDVLTMLDAYLTGTTNGVVPTPTSALVTGYDFLADAAEAIRQELASGLESSSPSSAVDTLIADPDLSFRDPSMWTANDLRDKLLQNRYDLMYLAGHFSANSALAADYATFISAEEIAESSVDLTNAIIFSNGCHSGYNIVNDHGVPNVTFEPDWAQAFAQKGATFIGGTGYQFGDTELLEYGERLYRDFSRALRTGSGPVSVGEALVAAKQTYLQSKPQIEGIDSKTITIATLFGFPMMQVNLPGQRIDPTSTDNAAVTSTALNPASADTPGEFLGLQSTDVSLTPQLTTETEQLLDLLNGTDPSNLLTVTYLSGSDGTVVKPSEPILPLEILDLTQPENVLRGVGLREATYTDTENVRPAVGAPATEIRGSQFTFPTDVFYPVKTWFVNYFGVLSDPNDGETLLLVTPAQYKSSSPGAETGTLRQFSNMLFRAYYNDNITTYGGNTPATSAAPTIARVFAASDGSILNFEAEVTGDPSAGIQEVWVLYTATTGSLYGQWQSLDLTQNSDESTLWEGSLTLPVDVQPDEVRYIVFAVNGVGLVSVDENIGAYHIPNIDPAEAPVSPQQQPSTLALVDNPPTSGPVGTQATFTALLESNGTPLANEQVTFSIGAASQIAITDSDGKASTTFSLTNDPGMYEVSVIFQGTPDFAASSATPLAFEITTQSTLLTLEPANDSILLGEETNIVATLTDANGTALRSKSVYFIVSGNGETYATALLTDPVGQVRLGQVPLPAGVYTVEAYFSGSIPLPTGTIDRTDVNYDPSVAIPTQLAIAEPFVISSCYVPDQTVEEYSPGLRKNGSPLPEQRSDAHNALGLPQNNDTLNFVSLGFEGTLVLKYANVIVNEPGDDIRVWETSFNDQNKPWSNFPEAVRVEVSQDGVTWLEIGTTSDKDQAYDFGSPDTLPWVKFVRLTDITDPARFGGSSDGFDVDAVEVLSFCSSTAP